jgi:hypothetical protein
LAAGCLIGCGRPAAPPAEEPAADDAADEQAAAEPESKSGPEEPAEAEPSPREAMLAKVTARYQLFLEEAGKGATLLEKRPTEEQLDDEITRLNELLKDATQGISDKKVQRLADNGHSLIKYFSGSFQNMQLHAQRNPDKPVTENQFVRQTCVENAAAIRKAIDLLKKNL